MSLWACNKENSELAKDLLKNDLAKVITVSPISIFGTTELDSEANTNKLDSAFVGTIEDHLFGTTSSACAMQLRIIGNSFVKREAGDNLEIDSVCMSIKFDLKRSVYDSLKFKEDLLPKQKVKIFSIAKDITAITKSSELDESVVGDNIVEGDIAELDYSTPTDVTHKSRYHNKDANSNGEFDVKGVMRINLKKVFGEKLLSLDSLDCISQEAFLKKINGIIISPESNTTGDGLFSFDPTSTLVTVHYRKGPVNEQDTLLVPFIVTSNSNVIAKFEHNHSAVINSAITDNTTDKLYVQGAAGLKANIMLPQYLYDESVAIPEGIEESSRMINKPKRIINKAELEIKVSEINYLDSEGNELDPKIVHIPASLVMMGYDSEGKIVTLPDYVVSRALAGGRYNKEDKSYIFNIVYLLQGIAASKDNAEFLSTTKIDLSKGFAIYPDYRRNNPRRVVLDGESINFNITYTDTEL